MQHVALFDHLLSQSGKTKDQLAGIGIALGGPWDGAVGKVGTRSLLPTWSEVDIADLFAKAFGVPVVVAISRTALPLQKPNGAMPRLTKRHSTSSFCMEKGARLSPTMLL